MVGHLAHLDCLQAGGPRRILHPARGSYTRPQLFGASPNKKWTGQWDLMLMLYGIWWDLVGFDVFSFNDDIMEPNGI